MLTNLILGYSYELYHLEESICVSGEANLISHFKKTNGLQNYFQLCPAGETVKERAEFIVYMGERCDTKIAT